MHRTDIAPKTGTPFRTLYTGEIVQYNLAPSDTDASESKAVNVCAPFGQHLICEHGRIHFISYSGINGRQQDDDEQYEPLSEDEAA